MSVWRETRITPARTQNLAADLPYTWPAGQVKESPLSERAPVGPSNLPVRAAGSLTFAQEGVVGETGCIAGRPRSGEEPPLRAPRRLSNRLFSSGAQ